MLLFMLLFMLRDERGKGSGQEALTRVRQRDELSRLAGGVDCWEQRCQQEEACIMS